MASGIGAELELADDALMLFGEGGGRAILASSDDLPFPRIGTVAGDTLLSLSIEDVRQAYEVRA
jgi:hypothetical protein